MTTSKRIFRVLVLGTFCFFLAKELSLAGQGNNMSSLRISSQSEESTGGFPTDAELLKSFAKHRGDFDRLQRMVNEDKTHGAIFSDDSLPESLSSERKKQYHSLFTAIRPGLTVTSDYDGIVRFIFAIHGSAALGPTSLKGIEFVPTGARFGGTVVQNLDDADHLAEGIYLRSIEPGWYLLYQATR